MQFKAKVWDLERKMMLGADQVCGLYFRDGLPYVVLAWEGKVEAILKFELLLFTGIRDRKAQEIYNKDKVEFKDIMIDGRSWSGTTHIWFRHGCFVLDKVGRYSVFAQDGKAGLGFYTPSLYEIDEKKLEVVGNILENPE